MNKDSKIYVAGHRGLLGSAIVRKLKSDGYNNLILKTSKELDLRNQAATFSFLQQERPDYVFMSAAKVGGIQANIDSPAVFLYDNLQIQNNVIEGSRLAKVKKLLFVASSCVYPREATCPIVEEALLTGPLEPTNESYALAKIAGVKMCQSYRKQFSCNFISAMPTNLFGINDHYDLRTSHLLPALILKIHTAQQEGRNSIDIWGSGKPRREFMLSDDCADALIFMMNNYSEEIPLNVGTGQDHSIIELAEIVAKVLGASIKFTLDTTKPDGMMKKLLNVQRINNLGWYSKYSIENAIKIAYNDFLEKRK